MHDQNMRLVQIMTMPGAGADAILEVLEEEGLEYSVSDHTGTQVVSDYSAVAQEEAADGGTQLSREASMVISFPIPANGVEPLLDRLDEHNIAETTYTVVIDAEAVITERFNHLREEPGEASPTQSERISRDELRSNARELLPGYGHYSVLTAIGAITATVGFLINSLAVIIGAMVIAPLFGPPNATAVATVTSDESLLRSSSKLQVLGAAVGVFSATGMAMVARFTPLARGTVDLGSVMATSSYGSSVFLLVILAFAAGIAGAIGLSTDEATIITQVMTASTLVPPVGVAGIGVAWGRPVLVVGAIVVMLINLLAIEIASIVTLWYLGYHPSSFAKLRETRSTILKLLVTLSALVGALTLFLVELTNGKVSSIVGKIV